MFSSIRVRLTLWHAAILALVLVLFSVSVYLLIAQRLYGEVDSDLRGVADVIAVSLRHEIEEHHGRAPGEQMFAGVLQTIHATSFPRQAIAVFQGDRLVAAKPGAGGDVRTRAIHAPEGWTTIDGGGVEQRLAMHAVRIAPADTTYRIAVALPLDRSRTQLADVRRVLWIAVPFAVLLAAAAGYLLALTSLAPVAAMTRTGEPDHRRQAGRAAPGSQPARRTRSTGRDLQPPARAARHGVRSATPFHGRRIARTADPDFGGAHRRRGHARQFRPFRGRLPRGPDGGCRADEPVDACGRRYVHAGAGPMPELTSTSRARATSTTFSRRRCWRRGCWGSRNPSRSSAGRFRSRPAPANEDLIRQLVLILLDNAIKYTPDGGRITVELSAGYRITVTDTGIGHPHRDAREGVPSLLSGGQGAIAIVGRAERRRRAGIVHRALDCRVAPGRRQSGVVRAGQRQPVRHHTAVPDRRLASVPALKLPRGHPAVEHQEPIRRIAFRHPPAQPATRSDASPDNPAAAGPARSAPPAANSRPPDTTRGCSDLPGRSRTPRQQAPQSEPAATRGAPPSPPARSPTTARPPAPRDAPTPAPGPRNSAGTRPRCRSTARRW